MKIVVSDVMQTRLRRQLQGRIDGAVRWEFCEDRDEVGLTRAIADADVYVGSVLTAEMAAAAHELRLVQVAGAGVDRIALDALPSRVVVANTYHHGPAIAEYVVMVMLALSRRLLIEDRRLRSGEWTGVFQQAEADIHESLAGQTVGLIGLGEIGHSVARLAAALGMRVVAVRRTHRVDPSRTATPTLAWVDSGRDALARLLGEADFVVVAAPLTDATRGMIGRSELERMKPTARVVNVARAGLIDEDALYDALDAGRIAGAALDVWWRYPDEGSVGPPSRRPFETLDNVIMTPHTSGMTEATFDARLRDVASNISAFMAGKPLHNVVRGGSA